MGDEERFHRHTGSASGVRPRTARLRRLSVPHRASIVDDVPVDVQSIISDRAVSYTHLTLPTICSV